MENSILKIFAGFIVMLGFLGFAPLVFLVVLYGLETLIAALQAYIFEGICLLWFINPHQTQIINQTKK